MARQVVYRLSDYYKPLPKQREFHETSAKYKCYMGGFGSGKTYALVMEALMLSMEFENNYGLIGRFTYRELWDTTMRDFFEVCPDFLIRDYKKTEHKLTLINGSVIIFRHLEEPDKLKSLNLGWFGIDEMTEVPEDVFDMLRSRLRKTNVGRRIGFGSTNPEGTDWVWRRFFKTHKNNPNYHIVVAPTTENIHLPDDYVDDLTEGMPDYWVKRYIHGDPTAFAGQIIRHYDDKVHAIEPFEVPADWARKVVLDHGTNNPTAVEWFATNPEGFHFIYKEHYRAQQTIEWHAEQIIKINESDNVDEWLADPAIFNKTLQDPKRGIHSVAERYSEFNIHFSPGDNDVKAGIQALVDAFKIHEKLINPVTGKPGSPRIFIFKSCEYARFEIPQYRWKDFRVRGRPKNLPEEPEKSNDHTVDDIRYFLMSKPKARIYKTKSRWGKGLTNEERIWQNLERKAKEHARMQKAIRQGYIYGQQRY